MYSVRSFDGWPGGRGTVNYSRTCFPRAASSGQKETAEQTTLRCRVAASNLYSRFIRKYCSHCKMTFEFFRLLVSH